MSLVSVTGIPLWVFIILITGVASEGPAPVTESTSQQGVKWNPISIASKLNLDWTKAEGGTFTLQGTKKKPGIGVIVSDKLKSNNEDHCLTFSKQIKGAINATLQVAVAKYLNSEKKILWSRIENIWTWQNVFIPISKTLTDEFIIIVTGFLADMRKDSIYISNFGFKEGECPASTKDDSILCNFEEGDFCRWDISKGKDTWTIAEGPQRIEIVDHRRYTQDLLGHYAIAKVTSEPDESTGYKPITLTSPKFQGGNKKCLRMYYLLLGGVKSDTFAVKIVKGDGVSSGVFHVSGTQGKTWREALVNVDGSSDYNIVVEYTPGHDGTIMAIDDITIVNGACPLFSLKEEITCGMENKKPGCSFTSVAYLGQKFEIGKGPTVPLPGLSTSGKVATYGVENPNPESWSTAFLTSEMYSTSSEKNCLTFSYSMNLNVDGVAFLRFYTTANLRFNQYIWERVLKDTHGWRKGMVEFETMKNYKIQFAAVITKNSTGTVEVSEYHLANSECPTEGAYINWCNFNHKDNTLCDWEARNNRGSTWIRTAQDSQASRYPKAAHHTYSGTGHYMLFKPSEKVKGKRATLMSPVFDTDAESSYCFTFWYIMGGTNPGHLEVHLNHKNMKAEQDTPLWQVIKGRGPYFFSGQVNINGTGHDQIYFSAFVPSDQSQNGYIAIDELSFEKGACEPQ